MHYLELNFWFDVIQFAMTGALAIYVWITNRNRVTVDRIQKLETMLDQGVASDRLSRIEDALARVPTTEDIAGIYKCFDSLHGDFRELAGKFEGMAKTHALVMEHMMEGRR